MGCSGGVGWSVLPVAGAGAAGCGRGAAECRAARRAVGAAGPDRPAAAGGTGAALLRGPDRPAVRRPARLLGGDGEVAGVARPSGDAQPAGEWAVTTDLERELRDLLHRRAGELGRAPVAT